MNRVNSGIATNIVTLIFATFSAVIISLGPANAEQRKIPINTAEIKLSFSPLVKRVAPAVVNVYASRMVSQTPATPFMNDPFFRRFFGQRSFGRPQQKAQRSLGSGVIISPGGVVVTNHHVIKDADQVRIVLSDRREFEADIVLKDERTDLAILQMKDADDQSFAFVEFSDSDDLEVGDIVLAIGNPFGVGQTVTQGIVSALARTQVGVTDYQFFIQTDAAINPGNSGGALIDMRGNLVGINTAIFSRSGGSNGIGFAIPTDMVRQVADSAAGGTRVQRPWLGAALQSVSADIAESMGLRRPTGAIVTRVDQNTPASRADLRVGDLVLEVAGHEINGPDAFGYRFATKRVGGTVELVVRRNGTDQVLMVALESAPETVPRDARDLATRSPFQGTRIANLSPAVAEELRLETHLEGVVITSIKPRSTAARVGLRTGDIIRRVNGVNVDLTETLAGIVRQVPYSWEIRFERKGKLLRINLRG
ncbi:MAG: Do family serine endopeptidase [Stappiaceae bacterium]